MKVKITELGYDDAFYDNRDSLVGLVGQCEVVADKENGYYGVRFIPEKFPEYFEMLSIINLAYVKFEVLEK